MFIAYSTYCLAPLQTFAGLPAANRAPQQGRQTWPVGLITWYNVCAYDSQLSATPHRLAWVHHSHRRYPMDLETTGRDWLDLRTTGQGPLDLRTAGRDRLGLSTTTGQGALGLITAGRDPLNFRTTALDRLDLRTTALDPLDLRTTVRTRRCRRPCCWHR